MQQEAPIRSYGRQELAAMYYPNLLPESAWKKLRKELQINPRLSPFLLSKHRTFLIREVHQIFEELGAPET